MDILVIVKRIDMSDNSPTKKLMDIADKTALDLAIGLRDKHGHGNSTVSVLCIAPAVASDVIRECYSLGADTAYMLSDPAFESIDLNGLISLLSGGIGFIGKCDAIIMASTSDDTVLVDVGKKLAEMIKFSHYSGVDSFEGTSNKIILKGKKGEKEIVEAPVLINLACDEEQYIHNAMRIMKAFKKEIRMITAKDLELKNKAENNIESENFVLNTNSKKNKY